MKKNTVKKVLWLDSSDCLDQNQLAHLSSRGIDLVKVSQNDLATLRLSDVSAIVVTLENDTSLLESVDAIFAERQMQLSVIVRIPRTAFELAVQVAKRSFTTAIATDILNTAAWAEVIERVGLIPGETTAKFIFVDPMSRKLLALTERVAGSNVTVLLAGPTGVGKEVLAKILHDASPRFKGPFVALNCAAMPENLIEDMLFGHEKGSFTGATKAQPGLFEQAQGGTIFLDEIGEMTYHLQAKLLRILQERTVTRLGGQDSIGLDIRVVAASNKNLKAEIINRTFREDLYFRLSAFKITIPALQDRPQDIIPLATHFASQYLGVGKNAQLSDEVQSSLLAYTWPGNVRELQNVMLRATVLTEDTMIGSEHLILDDNGLFGERDHFGATANLTATNSQALVVKAQDSIPHSLTSNDHNLSGQNKPLHQAMQANEYNVILAALQGSQSRNQAAHKLGISPRTLRHKLQRLREQGINVTRAYVR